MVRDNDQWFMDLARGMTWGYRAHLLLTLAALLPRLPGVHVGRDVPVVRLVQLLLEGRIALPDQMQTSCSAQRTQLWANDKPRGYCRGVGDATQRKVNLGWGQHVRIVQKLMFSAQHNPTTGGCKAQSACRGIERGDTDTTHFVLGRQAMMS